ncbi:MAG: AAA family ATPase [Chlorobium sp.]
MEHYNFYENKAEDSTFDLSSTMLLPDVEPGEEYHPSDALIKAVNVALMLQKPLLLTGAPGTGKSELAWHVARHFGWGKPEVFVTRTDSTATDLLYRYDSLAHFNRVNMQKAGNEVLTAPQIEKMFIKYVALGRAICDSVGDNPEHPSPRRRVVLIDEIDKAPRDLPNDILTTIELMTFDVPELNTCDNEECSIYEKKGNPKLKPVVILTSNSEKTLPEAFLRRCVFFHIDMPVEDDLQKILLSKKQLFEDMPLTLEEATAFRIMFNKISKIVNGKKPATHELILWVWWMKKQGLTPADIYNFKSGSADTKNETILSGISVLAKESRDLKAVQEAIVKNTIAP